jgi:hypothetical protein
VEVRVEFDSAPILAICDALKAPGFNEVAALALNDTIKNGQVETAQLLRPLMGIPSADIKAAIRTEPARPDNLEARVIGEGKAIPMIKFHVRDTRPHGVTLQVAGKTEVYKRAFIATVKHGHRGVFERKTPTGPRLPIRELYGPSVHGMMARSDVLPHIADTLNVRLLVNLKRELDRRIRREAGHYGGH